MKEIEKKLAALSDKERASVKAAFVNEYVNAFDFKLKKNDKVYNVFVTSTTSSIRNGSSFVSMTITVKNGTKIAHGYETSFKNDSEVKNKVKLKNYQILVQNPPLKHGGVVNPKGAMRDIVESVITKLI